METARLIETPAQAYERGAGALERQWGVALKFFGLALLGYLLAAVAQFLAQRASTPLGVLAWFAEYAVGAWLSKALLLAFYRLAYNEPIDEDLAWEWDRRVLDVFLVRLAIALLALAWLAPAAVLVGVAAYSHHIAEAVALGFLLGVPGVAGMIWVGVRLQPAQFLAADGQARPIQAAWRLTEPRFKATLELLFRAALPVLGVLAACVVAMTALMATEHPGFGVLAMLATLPFVLYYGAIAYTVSARWARVLVLSGEDEPGAEEAPAPPVTEASPADAPPAPRPRSAARRTPARRAVRKAPPKKAKPAKKAPAAKTKKAKKKR